MLREEGASELNDYLFATMEKNVFAILDGASIPDLLSKLDEYLPECQCLFPGELTPDMAEVAPYLVKLEPETEFLAWIMAMGWNKHWGIFAISGENITTLRRHFRSLLKVCDSEYRPLIFRYYDPRVLRRYLPTCTEAELATVFGPVDFYILEMGVADKALRLRFAAHQLQQETLLLQTE